MRRFSHSLALGIVRLRYEELVDRPETVLHAVSDDLDGDPVVPVPDIVATYTPDFVRKTWKQFNHVWRARPNAWRDLITPDRAQAIQSRHADIFETLDYHCPANRLSDQQAEAHWHAMK